MNKILEIIAIIAFIIFIIYNIVEIVLANKFYKKLEKENKALIDKLIDEAVDNLTGE